MANLFDTQKNSGITYITKVYRTLTLTTLLDES